VRTLEVKIEASITEDLVANLATIRMQIAKSCAAVGTGFGGGKAAGKSLDLFEDDSAGGRRCDFVGQEILVGRNAKSESTLVTSALGCCPRLIYASWIVRLIQDSW
jgi:hypothetical protein